jgi:hypothetical protein
VKTWFFQVSLFPQSKRRVAWPFILAGLIFVASGHQAASGPDITGSDKVVHMGVFGLLATLFCRLGHGWKAAAWGFLVASTYGALDEWHQSFVPYRSSEVADWIADTVGAALAVILYTGWLGYRRWLETPLRFRLRKKPAEQVPRLG